MVRFNEAVGILRRKPGKAMAEAERAGIASMRPSEFSDGNYSSHIESANRAMEELQ